MTDERMAEVEIAVRTFFKMPAPEKLNLDEEYAFLTSLMWWVGSGQPQFSKGTGISPIELNQFYSRKINQHGGRFGL